MDKKLLVPLLSVLMFAGIMFVGLVLGAVLLTPGPAASQGEPDAVYTQAYQTIEAVGHGRHHIGNADPHPDEYPEDPYGHTHANPFRFGGRGLQPGTVHCRRHRSG
jgi:hypothetical protein